MPIRQVAITALLIVLGQPAMLAAAAAAKSADGKTPAAGAKSGAAKAVRKSAGKTGAEAASADAGGQPARPLDLTVEFTPADTARMADKIKPALRSERVSIFTEREQSRADPIQLGGRLIMSPEPEIEKRKSADGAGIEINLKP